jgi:hypothetical protein
LYNDLTSGKIRGVTFDRYESWFITIWKKVI